MCKPRAYFLIFLSIYDNVERLYFQNLRRELSKNYNEHLDELRKNNYRKSCKE